MTSVRQIFYVHPMRSLSTCRIGSLFFLSRMGERGGTGGFSDELSQYSRVGLPITLSGRFFGFRVLFPHMYVPNGVVLYGVPVFPPYLG